MLKGHLPPKVVAIDVETTGLYSYDRIVSLGIVELDTKRLVEDKATIDVQHLVFDPGRKSHPRAELVHGWDDWTLRHQNPFAKYATEIHALLTSADLLVAHNTAFDLPFLNRELMQAGLQIIETNAFCTMRNSWVRPEVTSAALKNIVPHLGLQRISEIHGALEDAWLSMCVFLWLHERPHLGPFNFIEKPEPRNYVLPPVRPDGPLPRRRSRKAAIRSEPELPAAEINDTPRWTLIKRICRAGGVPILCSIALSDFDLAKIEIEIIAAHAQSCCFQRGIELVADEIGKLYDYIGRMRPSDGAIEKAMAGLAQASEGEIVRFMRTAMAVIAADGKVRPEEADALRALYKTITGRSFG